MTEAPERIWARESHSERTNETMVAWDTPSKHPEEQEYIRADLAKPRVKPLAWLGGAGRWHAGDYCIEDVSHGQREVRRLLRASFGTTYVADFSGGRPLEAAKAAAQADYERRILEALE